MTDIIFSHDTALAYWSHPAAQRLPMLDPTAAQASLQTIRGEAHTKTIEKLLDSPLLNGFPRPLDVLVPTPGDRRSSRRCRYHYCSELVGESVSMIPNGLLEVEGNIYRLLLCTPEMTLAQMAGLVGEIELLEIAYELCGCYSLQPEHVNKLAKRDPVTSIDYIEKLLADIHGTRGLRKLRDVSVWILENSRSPKESQLAIASVLPRSRGGYGMPRPLLNQKLDVPASVIPVLGSPTIIPDLHWPSKKIVLEYDSNSEHTHQTANHDARKRSAYRMMGLELISMTPDQLFDRAAFENIMSGLERRLKRDSKPPTGKQLEKRAHLYDCLFRKQRRERAFVLQTTHSAR